GGGAEGGEELGGQRPGEGEQQHQGRQDHGGACGDPAPGPGRRAQGEGPGLGRRLGLRSLGLGLGLGLGSLSLGMGAHRAVTVALRVGAVEPVRRSLASRTGYMRSTIRLISTNTTVDSTTTAIRTGVSRAATAWAVSGPMPIRAKTVSVTTAPPTSSPNRSPAMVRVGSRALRATVRHSSHQVEAPRARDTATKGWAETSSIERISTW